MSHVLELLSSDKLHVCDSALSTNNNSNEIDLKCAVLYPFVDLYFSSWNSLTQL